MGLFWSWLFTNDIFMQQLLGCKCPFDFFLIFTKKQESEETLKRIKPHCGSHAKSLRSEQCFDGIQLISKVDTSNHTVINFDNFFATFFVNYNFYITSCFLSSFLGRLICYEVQIGRDKLYWFYLNDKT